MKTEWHGCRWNLVLCVGGKKSDFFWIKEVGVTCVTLINNNNKKQTKLFGNVAFFIFFIL